MVRFSKGRDLSLAIAMVPIAQKTGPFEIRTFLSGFQMLFDKMAAICPDIKWLNLRNLKCHLKSRSFANQLTFDHSKSGLIWISDPHCKLSVSNDQA